MLHYFDDWTDEELQRLQEVFGDNYEYDKYEQCVILNQPEAEWDEIIKFFKKDGEYYVETEEDEGCFDYRGDSIYYLDPTWWYQVDLENILQDYADGVEIEANEYRV